MDFDTLASQGGGRDLLGVLRMDVDNLGLIFVKGLADASISRVSDLSARLDWFFAGWVNHLCQTPEFLNRASILYSGGDDLFIVGSASSMPLLAGKIREDFRRYTCQHPQVTISAGVLFAEPRLPLVRAADAGGDLLDSAKGGDKNAINLFGAVHKWETFQKLLTLRNIIYECMSGVRKQPRSFLRTLLVLGEEYAEKYQRGLAFFQYGASENAPFILQRKEYLRAVFPLVGENPEAAARRVADGTAWKWMFHYYYRRNWVTRENEAKMEQLRAFLLADPGPALLFPAARWVELETQKENQIEKGTGF